MHFLYVFILRFLCNSTCFERPFRSSSGVHELLYPQLCTNHANVKNRRIDTYRKCILLVCLYNWLRCTVHTMSNLTFQFSGVNNVVYDYIKCHIILNIVQIYVSQYTVTHNTIYKSLR